MRLLTVFVCIVVSVQTYKLLLLRFAPMFFCPPGGLDLLVELLLLVRELAQPQLGAVLCYFVCVCLFVCLFVLSVVCMLFNRTMS